MKGIELECESPSFWVSIVLLQDVDTTDILPQVDWLFDSFYVQKAEEG